MWGYGEVGIALEWHSRGQGFESPYLHQIRTMILIQWKTLEFRGFYCFLS